MSLEGWGAGMELRAASRLLARLAESGSGLRPALRAARLEPCEFSSRRTTFLAAFADLLIGAPGFEPGTSCSQSRRATGLRHAPFSLLLQCISCYLCVCHESKLCQKLLWKPTMGRIFPSVAGRPARLEDEANRPTTDTRRPGRRTLGRGRLRVKARKLCQ